MYLPLQNFDRDLSEISPRSRRESRRESRWVFGWRDCRVSARSRRDLKISAAKNSLRFLPRSRRDLKISSRFLTRSWRDLKISAAKKPPRFSPRSQNLVKIPGRDLDEISKSRRPKTHRESRQISSKILARSQSLGGQNLAENLGKTSSKISSRHQNLVGQKNLAEKTRSFLYFKMSILRFRKTFHKFFDWSSF